LKRIPVVDIAECVDCGGCIELCPEAFKKNEMGYIEVVALSKYPQSAIQEAINICPADCMTWEEV
jgi:ferredoxin